MRLPMLFIILSLLAPLKPAHCQDHPDCKTRLKQSRLRIEKLEAEVQALKDDLAGLKKKLSEEEPLEEEPLDDIPAERAPDTDTPKPKFDYSAIVRKLDPDCDATDICRYLLEREGLNQVIKDLDALGRQARVIPNYDRDSGTYRGFKLIGVRPNSFYRAIGIRSGDVIHKSNDLDLSSPSRVLEMFTQFQTKNVVVLHISRRGSDRLHVCQIVDDITRPAPPLPKDLSPKPAMPLTVPEESVFIRPAGDNTFLVDLSKVPDIVPANAVTSRYVSKPDKVAGIEVDKIWKASWADQLGLMNGDIIVRIAGENIGKNTTPFRLLELLEEPGIIKVLILRRGKQIMLKYKVVDRFAD